jgi:hypothetical protein
MVDLGKCLPVSRKMARVFFVITLCTVTGGCAGLTKINDPCAMANRDVSFSVLLENSISNVYNMCLERMRQEIVAEWGEQ